MSDWQWVSDLYAEKPDFEALYHYTSIGGAMAIAEKAHLFATELRYLNDTSEGSILAMRITAEMHDLASRRLTQAQERLLNQCRPWIENRMRDGHMVFVASFTSRGDQLSQWRGYCPPGKGISLGFDPAKVQQVAEAHDFELGRCVYSLSHQKTMARNILEWLLGQADNGMEVLDPSKQHPNNSFHDLFESVEDQLLRASALCKDPAFEDEQEWRVVRKPITSYHPGSPIQYREGASMIVPYVAFPLPRGTHKTAALKRVIVGPTPHTDAARDSLHRFLYGLGSYPSGHVHSSVIPYRAW